MGRGLSTLELLNSYQINEYSVPEPTPKPAANKVTFKDSKRSKNQVNSSMRVNS